MKLYVVRHGEAVGKHVDPGCPLSAVGRSEVAEVGAFLEGADVKVDRILHSGKARAAQTAEILASSVLDEGKPEMSDGLLPLDSVAEFAVWLEGRDENLMVVGHLPFVGRLVARLAGGDPEGGTVSFDAGTTACLERSEDRRWSIRWMVGPRQIGE